MKKAKYPFEKFRGRLVRWVTPFYRSLFFPPFVVALAIIVATVFGWRAAETSLDQDITSAAQARISTVEQAIQENLNSYEQILRGGVGLFQGSNEVTRDDWRNYLSAFKVEQNYPSIQSIGFARVLSASEIPSLVQYMASQGIRDFTIKPSPEPSREIFAPVIYVESTESNQSPIFGFDMYSEPSRQAAAFEARDSGLISITPGIELHSTDPTPPIGFKMYESYYDVGKPTQTVAERQAALRGYVFASFRSNVFFDEVAERTDNKAMGFYVTSKGEDPFGNLYESANFAKISKKSGVYTTTREQELYGQTWIIRYALDQHRLVSDPQLRRPEGILFFGIFSAILIGTIVLLLLRNRARELAVQKEHAVELAKDELLSLASHQLRTPATGVKQYLGMVLQGFAGKVPSNQRGLLEKAYTSNDRQLHIINDILHLAKIDAGRIVLAKQDINLNEFVTDIVNEQKPDIKTAKHKVKLELYRKPIITNADPHMLRMAIENLLSNAIKYTHQGGMITIRTHKSRSNVIVSIKDTGIGIDQADTDKIFQQFSRLPNEMSQQVGGTGIGLYLAKHLVELHDGRIEVHSTSGKGSTFTIILPTAKRTAIKNLTVGTRPQL
jgi:signal transduction histidine kinase